MFDLFSWIRRRAAESVINGVADGVKAITPEGEAPPADLGELRALLAAAVQPKALPAAKDATADDEPARGKKR